MEFASVTVKPTTTALPSTNTQKAQNHQNSEKVDSSDEFFKNSATKMAGDTNKTEQTKVDKRPQFEEKQIGFVPKNGNYGDPKADTKNFQNTKATTFTDGHSHIGKLDENKDGTKTFAFRNTGSDYATAGLLTGDAKNGFTLDAFEGHPHPDAQDANKTFKDDDRIASRNSMRLRIRDAIEVQLTVMGVGAQDRRTFGTDLGTRSVGGEIGKLKSNQASLSPEQKQLLTLVEMHDGVDLAKINYEKKIKNPDDPKVANNTPGVPGDIPGKIPGGPSDVPTTKTPDKGTPVGGGTPETKISKPDTYVIKKTIVANCETTHGVTHSGNVNYETDALVDKANAAKDRLNSVYDLKNVKISYGKTVEDRVNLERTIVVIEVPIKDKPGKSLKLEYQMTPHTVELGRDAEVRVKMENTEDLKVENGQDVRKSEDLKDLLQGLYVGIRNATSNDADGTWRSGRTEGTKANRNLAELAVREHQEYDIAGTGKETKIYDLASVKEIKDVTPGKVDTSLVAKEKGHITFVASGAVPKK